MNHSMKKLSHTAATLALAAAFIPFAHAEGPKTREQVKAELADAVLHGEMPATGDSGLTLAELYRGRYPKRATPPSLTRAEVKAALADAVRSGDLLATGDSGLRLNEINPQRYPAANPVAMGKTRAEVRAELAEAIRTGDMLSSDQSGLKLNEEFPQRYATHAAHADAGADHTVMR